MKAQPFQNIEENNLHWSNTVVLCCDSCCIMPKRQQYKMREFRVQAEDGYKNSFDINIYVP